MSKKPGLIIAASGIIAVATAVFLWPMYSGTGDQAPVTSVAVKDTTAHRCRSFTEDINTKPETAGMQWITGGTFAMGSDAAYREEGPVRDVTVDGFWIDTHEITNHQYSKFANETGYVTVAERLPDANMLEGAPPEMFKPGSVMFRQPKNIVSTEMLQWWIYQPGANWRHPQGPGSGLEDRLNYPVVHIAFEDAQAYADWAGRVLPTEAQWEFAARSNSDGSTYSWGEERVPEGNHMANTWQGLFPVRNTEEDGYRAASPVGCFPANAYGIYDLIGNVWEWTADRYAIHHGIGEMVGETITNPTGPTAAQSGDPRQPGFPVRVIKGGSFLCAPNYCMRYRPTARQAQDTGLGSDHIGFRTVLNPPTI